MNTESIWARFFSKVERKDTGCWEWTAGVLLPPNEPYGRIKVDGKTKRAHRVSWALIYGEIPEDVWVLHKCDNPRCVSPFHLFTGTPKDNTQDCIRKGRFPDRTGTHPKTGIGEDHYCSKLTDGNVAKIRATYDKFTNGFQALAERYGVTKQAIRKVVLRHSWQHLP